MTRVLIGCPTYSGKNYCIKRFLERLAIIKKEHDVLFVDNSDDDSHSEIIHAAGFEVIKTKKDVDLIATIINNRQKIIDRVLERNYDYLLFLDTDIIPPEDVIIRLLSHKKYIVTGVYPGLMKIQGKVRIAPVIYEFSQKKDYFKPIAINAVLDDEFKEIAACGFGCVLISKRVLEKVRLRYNKELGSGEDIPFCRDARELCGFQTFVDTSIKCTHVQKDRDLDFPAGVASFSVTYDLE